MSGLFGDLNSFLWQLSGHFRITAFTCDLPILSVNNQIPVRIYSKAPCICKCFSFRICNKGEFDISIAFDRPGISQRYYILIFALKGVVGQLEFFVLVFTAEHEKQSFRRESPRKLCFSCSPRFLKFYSFYLHIHNIPIVKLSMLFKLYHPISL